MQPHELFSTMVTFSRDFEKAKDEVAERERKQLREERQQERKRTPIKTTPPKSQSPQKSMLRASNLQPNMGSVLQQLKTSALPLRRTISDSVGDQQAQAPSRQQSERHSDTSISQPPAVSKNSLHATFTEFKAPEPCQRTKYEIQPSKFNKESTVSSIYVDNNVGIYGKDKAASSSDTHETERICYCGISPSGLRSTKSVFSGSSNL